MIVVSDTSAMTALIQIGRTELLVRLPDVLEQVTETDLGIGKDLKDRSFREDEAEQ